MGVLRPMVGRGGWVGVVVVVVAGSEMSEDKAEEDCWVGDDWTLVVAGLRRGDVRRTGESGAGWVCTPGSAMSKDRRVAVVEVTCVSSGVARLCSGWRA